MFVDIDNLLILIAEPKKGFPNVLLEVSNIVTHLSINANLQMTLIK